MGFCGFFKVRHKDQKDSQLLVLPGSPRMRAGRVTDSKGASVVTRKGGTFLGQMCQVSLEDQSQLHVVIPPKHQKQPKVMYSPT